VIWFSVYAIIAIVRYVATGSMGWVSQMPRACSRIIALTAVFAGLTMAHAADATLTLACQGTTTSGLEDAKPKPISMGIIVNFTNRTVQGFGTPGILDYPIKITAWNDVTVVFAG
jgi:hypothetical protein